MSQNGTVVVGEYKGRPVALIQDHPYYRRDGHIIVKRRYEYADKFKENGKPEKEFVWPPGTKLSDLHLFGWEDLKRLQPGEPIFLVEGEKTADALSKRGFIAVSMAASSMRDLSALDEIFSYPQNPVIVCPDNDTPGFKAAALWEQHLKRGHPQVRWLAPVVEEPGGDFADFLARFGRDEDKEARAAVLEMVATAADGSPGLTPAEIPSAPVSEYGWPVSASTLVEPGPREWVVADIVPDKWPTILYGDGGVGITTISNHLAVCVCEGIDWFGRPVSQRRVLVVDAELDQEEFARRIWQIARGLGMTRPPEGVYYWRLPKALSREDIQEHMAKMVEDLGIGLLIVDSLTLATHLSDQNAAGDISQLIFNTTKQGVATIFLDHHARQSNALDDDARVDPYGSVMKRNLARSAIYLTTYGEGLVRLRANKVSFAARWEPFVVEVVFAGQHPEQIIRYGSVATNDPRVVAAKSRDANEQIVDAVQDLMESDDTMRRMGVPLERLEPLFPELAKTEALRMRCMRLVKGGRLVKLGDKTYAIAVLLPTD